MSNRYSFYVVSNGTKYSFDKLSELKEFADDQQTDIESFDIQLGDHCDSLTDDEFTGFYNLKFISDYHLNLFEKGELFEFQMV